MTTLSVCLLGFGEVGQALCLDLRARVGQMSAWDLKFSDTASLPSRAATPHEGLAASNAKQAVAGADLVISAVTAAQIGEAAASVAPHLKRDAYFFDLNSTSPAAKAQAAGIVDSAGGRFIEAAIMSPIAPRRAASPMLLGGAHAAGFLPLARELGFAGAEAFSGKIGAASAAKMCRSVVVKGLEALMLESLFAANGASVNPRYLISRALVHGRRRAEEMGEAAHTVAEAGVSSRMSSACAEWQEWASHHPEAAASQDIGAMLDALLSARRSAPC
jgi:3-hydroxyisobutyrate dehydrogenase-like beta-hydroxyacid dehydrogenase